MNWTLWRNRIPPVKKGDRQIPEETLNGIIAIVNALRVCTIDGVQGSINSIDGLKAIVDATASSSKSSITGSFPGYGYVYGKKTGDLDVFPNKPWVKVRRSTGVSTEEIGPPPDPFPSDEVWFEKSVTLEPFYVY